MMKSANFKPRNLNLGCGSRHNPQAIIVDLTATDMARGLLEYAIRKLKVQTSQCNVDVYNQH